MTFDQIEETFTKMGGAFNTPPILLSKKLKNVRALFFDWDGVWHSGRKTADGQSSFSEVDSMGLNMLRFGFYLISGNIPHTFIVTGENNQTAKKLAEREHLDAVIMKAKDKRIALKYCTEKWDFKNKETLFVFDDILDLGMASQTATNFFVNRTGSPLLTKYVADQKLCDYTTANDGNQNAIREISEIVLALLGKFEATVENRMRVSDAYVDYLAKRNALKTEYLRIEKQVVVDE